jgi:hypothetical protein
MARPTMSALITQTRLMIADPSGTNQVFTDDQVQMKLDELRDDIWYEQLSAAPAVVNAASTNNQPQMVFADFYSAYHWWEDGVVLQGYFGGKASVVLTPVASDLLVGHWQFQLNIFASGTAPGQFPPVWATGKIYDLYAASADLLDMRATTLSLTTFDFSSDSQSFKVSQVIDNMRKAALSYRRQAKPKIAKMVRRDVAPEIDTKSVPVLGGDGSFGGIY